MSQINSKSKKITLTAVFIATGILFPILFHMLSLGKAMLPMFWPVVVAGFILPIGYGCIVAIMTPLLSMLITGMPPVSPPVMQMMILELNAIVLVIGALTQWTTWGVLPIIATSLLASRLALFLGSPLLAWAFGLPKEWLFWSRLLESLPGILSMLVFIPFFIRRISHFPVLKGRLHS